MADRDLALRSEGARIKGRIRELEKTKQTLASRSSSYTPKAQEYARKREAFEAKYEKYTSGVRGSKVFQPQRQESSRVVKKAFKEYAKEGKELSEQQKALEAERKELVGLQSNIKSQTASIQKEASEYNIKADIAFKKAVSDAKFQADLKEEDEKFYFEDPTRGSNPIFFPRVEVPKDVYLAELKKRDPTGRISLADPPTDIQLLRQKVPEIGVIERAGKEVYGLGRETIIGTGRVISGTYAFATSPLYRELKLREAYEGTKEFISDPQAGISAIGSGIRQQTFDKPYATIASVPLFFWGGKGIGKGLGKPIGFFRQPARILFKGQTIRGSKVVTGTGQSLSRAQVLGKRLKLGEPQPRAFAFEAQRARDIGQISLDVGRTRKPLIDGGEVQALSRSISAETATLGNVRLYLGGTQVFVKPSKVPKTYLFESAVVQTDDISGIFGGLKQITKVKKKKGDFKLSRYTTQFKGAVEQVDPIAPSNIIKGSGQVVKQQVKPLTKATTENIIKEVTKAATPKQPKLFAPTKPTIQPAQPALTTQAPQIQLQAPRTKVATIQAQTPKDIQRTRTRTKALTQSKQKQQQKQILKQSPVPKTRQVLRSGLITRQATKQRQKQKTIQRQKIFVSSGSYSFPATKPPTIGVPIGFPLPKLGRQPKGKKKKRGSTPVSRTYRYTPSLSALSKPAVRGKPPLKVTGLEIRRRLK